MGSYMNQNSIKKILKNTQIEHLLNKDDIVKNISKNISNSFLSLYEKDSNPNDLIRKFSSIKNLFSIQKQLNNSKSTYPLGVIKQYLDSQIYLKNHAITIPLKKKSNSHFKMIKVGLEDASQKNWSIYTKAFGSNIALSRNVKVKMQPFYISQYPISTKMFLDVMGRNATTRKTYPDFFYDDTNAEFTFDNNPNREVSGIRFIDALKFCNKLSKLHDLKEVYTIKWVPGNFDNGYELYYNRSANGYKLPNILQWEYAMEGGLQNDFYFGTSEKDNVSLYLPNRDYFNDPTMNMFNINILPNRFGIYFLQEDELVNDLGESDLDIFVNNIKWTYRDIEADGKIDASSSMFGFVENKLTEYRFYCSIGYSYHKGLRNITTHERDDISHEILTDTFRIIKNA